MRSIENYLWEEVIARQPEAVQEFLLRTSILSPFNAPLCDAVTGRTDSAAMIRQLERDGLFIIALDDVGQWYRYHHLFADVLRDRLEQTVSDDELAGLHRRAAAWLEEQGSIEDATRHAMAGRDWDRAVRLAREYRRATLRAGPHSRALPLVAGSSTGNSRAESPARLLVGVRAEPGWPLSAGRTTAPHRRAGLDRAARSC